MSARVTLNVSRAAAAKALLARMSNDELEAFVNSELDDLHNIRIVGDTEPANDDSELLSLLS